MGNKHVAVALINAPHIHQDPPLQAVTSAEAGVLRGLGVTRNEALP